MFFCLEKNKTITISPEPSPEQSCQRIANAKKKRTSDCSYISSIPPESSSATLFLIIKPTPLDLQISHDFAWMCLHSPLLLTVWCLNPAPPCCVEWQKTRIWCFNNIFLDISLSNCTTAPPSQVLLFLLETNSDTVILHTHTHISPPFPYFRFNCSSSRTTTTTTSTQNTQNASLFHGKEAQVSLRAVEAGAGATARAAAATGIKSSQSLPTAAAAAADSGQLLQGWAYVTRAGGSRRCPRHQQRSR